MANLLRNITRRMPLTRRMRLLFRNRQAQGIAVLILMIVAVIAVISLAETGGNDAFGSFSDIFYWALVTITTVGYGDITPHTVTGRLFTVFLIMMGVVLVSFMTATIASILTTTRIREGMGLKKVELDRHIVVCGFNFNLERVIKSIISSSQGASPEIVLVNAQDESDINALIERFPEVPIRFVYGDYTHESTLNRASISKAASAIILADPGPDKTSKPDDRTLLTVLAIKSMSQDLRVCVELTDSANEVHLRRAGVDQIIVSGEFSGFLLANSVLSPGLPQVMKEMMYVSMGSDIRRAPMPRDMVGRTFREATHDFLDRSGEILVGVITEKKTFNLDTVLTGDKGAIDDFIRRKFEEAGRSLEVESKGLVTVKVNPGKDYVISEDDYAVIITAKKGPASS